MRRETEYLPGHESSTKGMPAIADALQRRGIDPHVLVEGTPHSLEDIQDIARRIDWTSACQIFANAGRHVGDEGLVAVGREMVKSRSHRFGVVVGRVLFSKAEFYRWTAETAIQESFKSLTARVVDLAQNRILIEYEMREGFEPCRALFYLMKGMYSIDPLALGTQLNQVEMELLPNGVRYDVQFKVGGGHLAWMRKSIGWIFAARYAAEALQSADDVISKRYADLLDETKARREAEQALVEVVAREQQRIRRDLHDRVGQELTGLSFLTRRLVQRPNHSPGQRAEALEAIVAGIERAIGEVQAAIEGLGPVRDTPFGLAEALDELVARMSMRTHARCTFDCSDEVLVEDNSVATHLFHIGQEALNNACKYSEAGNIGVELSRQNGTIDLIVHDDGIGLRNGNGQGTGLGTSIMRHRAQLINGEFKLEPCAQGGTRAVCRVPISKPRLRDSIKP